MEQLTFYLFLIITAAVAIWEFNRPDGYLQLPFLSAVVYLGWVIPQLWSIRTTYPYFADDLAILNLMCALCLIATVLGWRSGQRMPFRAFSGRFFSYQQDRTLIIAATVLTTIAVVTLILMKGRPEDELNTTTPSGFITILYLIFGIKLFSLTLSLILLLKRRTNFRFALVAVNCFLYAPLIFIYFRRAAMAEFALAVGLSFWFARRRLVPRYIILGGLIAGMLVVFATGQLRELARTQNSNEAGWSMPTYDRLAKVDFLGSTPFTDNSNASEMLNALQLVSLALKDGFTYGAATWNRFVFQYVPAQFVGPELKASLLFDTNFRYRLMYEMDHVVARGSTFTGPGTAFIELGPLGAILFFITAMILSGWYGRACSGDPWAQALYAMGVVPGLHSITHSASQFFVSMTFLWGVVVVIRWCLERQLRLPRSNANIPRRSQFSRLSRKF